MSKQVKSLAKVLGFGKIVRFLRKNPPLLLFYALEIFRRNNGERKEVRVNGKIAIYDVFSCKGNKYIAFVGYYGRLSEVESITCTFQSGGVSKIRWINDFPHEHEGEQVLIGLFSVPEADKRAGETSISLRSQAGILLDGLKIHFPEHKKKHYLSVVTKMKDEDRYLEEWIEYYRVLGADHFYIYDNRSLRRNKIRKILRPYIDRGIVTLLDWDYPHTHTPDMSWRFCQRGQMHHCLYKYEDLSRWMLFIDVDEFVYPADSTQMSLLPLLKTYDEKSDVAAIQFKMVWFGNAGFSTVPPGLVIDNYTHRATEVVPQGREKCCVKPDKVELLYIHDIKKCAKGSRKVMAPPEQYRINHYYATSSSRRHRSDSQFNEVEDNGMLRFVPQVSERLRNKRLYRQNGNGSQ